MRQLKIASNNITNRDNEALTKYLQDISREAMVSPEEEVDLAQRIRRGDQQALDRLILANLRFVVSVAKQYQGQGLGLIDLINEGNMGLIKAARMFDDTRGFKFISYAVWWIRQSILQAIADQSRMIRMPSNQVGLINRIGRFRNQFVQDNEREPTNVEIAEALDLDPDKVKTVLESSNRPLSVDAPITDGEETNMLDLYTNEDTAAPTDRKLVTESLKRELSDLLNTLPEKEARVLRMHFGLGCQEASLDEIAEKLGLSRERVRQIREKAIGLLRATKGSETLKSYL
ncbi:MAG: RNA polymerase sigma factor RpoD/SigA [Alloprevotella sp.]